jgi:hypothetical protein
MIASECEEGGGGGGGAPGSGMKLRTIIAAFFLVASFTAQNVTLGQRDPFKGYVL